eukprot:TRINITY_DN70085_c0_g1_i1.p1 TRINITY_DN70085_c0_g1~~TRINITY_DN70085_c0_g1_i1.p1  ORF type:complete len:184 (+),score=65.68 TRINITY_DN70085_c0_g1_i1:81-632(+)
MPTATELIKNLGSSNSSTWGSREEEQKGRAAIHESQVRRYAGRNERLFAGHTVNLEQEEADRAAAAKRKQAQDCEISELLEAQQQKDTGSVAPKAAGLFQGVAKNESKSKKLPGFMAVKKQRTDEVASTASAPSAAEDEAEAVAASAARPAPAAAGGIGLGAYGSSSESSGEEDAAALPAAAL